MAIVMMVDVVDRGVSQVLDYMKKRDISFQDMNILVTGGAGFIGSWLCDVLVRDGARVICLDNLASGMRKNIDHLEAEDNFRFVEHDISKPIFIDERFDLIFHLASRASPLEFTRYPISILKANTLGLWVALGIAKKDRARIVYTSTSEVYGNPDPKYVPTPETYNGNVNPIGTRSCYDESKRAGEAFVMAYRMEHGLDTRMVRIFNTYGPRMRADDIYGRVVPRFITQCLTEAPITVFGDGTQTRSFTYITDQLRGILLLGALDEIDGCVVNIGNNREIQIIELAGIIKEITGSESPIEYHPLPEDDPRRRCPDITRAGELLIWEPEVDLEEGLSYTIEWFKKHVV